MAASVFCRTTIYNHKCCRGQRSSTAEHQSEWCGVSRMPEHWTRQPVLYVWRRSQQWTAWTRCVSYYLGNVKWTKFYRICLIMIILKVREHNRIAAGLKALNSHWDDSRIFDEARRIIIAELQHVAYNEWLPRVVGQPVTNLFGLSLKRSG